MSSSKGSISVPNGKDLDTIRPPLTFSDEELVGGKPNILHRVTVQAMMANHLVHTILMDEGSAHDIMSLGLLTSLGILMRDLDSYQRENLLGLSGTPVTPLGYIRLSVTYGKSPLSRAVNTSSWCYLV